MATSEATLAIFYSSVSGNLEIKKQQERIFNVLDGKKILYLKHDISADEALKIKMREIVGADALPPQICNGSLYLGSFDNFNNAIEDEKLEEFLKIA